MADSHRLKLWGVLGGTTAAVFAVWLILLPDTVTTYFAWDVQPRMTQLFVGAGYIFRTAFFFAIALEPRWRRVSWMYWGNLAFTGALLAATYLHADEFLWGQFLPPTAHLWIILYIFEPVAMLYLVPRSAGHLERPVAGGEVTPALRMFLILAVGLMLMFGLLLLVNPALAANRWPWDLNHLDSRIMSAWFLGWAGWAGAMAFSNYWDDIKLGVQLMILNGTVVLAAAVSQLSSLRFDGKTTTLVLAIGTIGLTAGAATLYVVQERRRPSVVAADAPALTDVAAGSPR